MDETVGSTDKENSKPKGKEFIRIMKYFRRKWLLVLCVFMTIILGASPFLLNLFLGNLVDTLSNPNFTNEELTDAILAIVYLLTAHNLVVVINFELRSIANPDFMYNLRDNIYKQLMRQDISYFDSTPTGVLMGRLSQDTAIIFQIYIDKMLMICQSLTQSFLGLILCYIVMWQAALLATVVIAICLIIYYYADKSIDKLWAECNSNRSDAASKANEILTSFRTIKSFDNEMREAKSYGKAVDSVDAVYKKTSIAQGLKDSVIMGIINLMVIAIIYLASHLIVEVPDSGYESGSIFTLAIQLLFGTQGISLCLSLSDDFKNARISAGKVLDILDLETGVDEKSGKKQLENVTGKIEFRDVGFKYNTKDDWAVRHLTFTVEPGQTVALVGESGCGKTTTLQLLQRFYQIQEGEILIDGVNINDLNPKYVRSLIGVVPQGPVLFSMSICDNIRFSKSGATKEEVINAAKIGNAHQFIMEIPDNYDTQVKQTSLSGGQKQRICISRAILANAPILLLDEATASLDTESEQLVQQSLENYRKGKTAILVAHRLSTVINSDKIFVYHDGHIAEEGTHRELIALNGLYSELVKFQLQ